MPDVLIPTGRAVLVFGRMKRLRPQSKLVKLLEPVARRAGPWVVAVTGDTPVLSRMDTRSEAAVITMAQVTDTVDREKTLLLVKVKPDKQLAVLFPVTRTRKPKTLDISRNSQLSMQNSWGAVVIVPEAKVLLVDRR